MGNIGHYSMNSKTDFLKECISDVSSKLHRMVPIDDFNRTFCVVCVNRDCARSKSNNLKFESRVNNWEDLYFNKVKRADNQDPQFESIRIKRFVSPEDRSTYIIKEPELEPKPEPKTNLDPEPVLEPVIQAPEKEPQPMDVPELNVPKPKESIPDPIPQAVDQVTNTPFVQGTMLPGSKQATVLESSQVFVFDDDNEEQAKPGVG